MDRESFNFVDMKRIILLLLLALPLSALGQSNSYYTYCAKYHPFEEGVQMVEICFGVDIQTFAGYHMPRASYDPPEPPPPNPSIYIFRDKAGRILKTFNICGSTTLDSFTLKHPDELKKDDIKPFAADRFAIVEHCPSRTGKSFDGTAPVPFNLSLYTDADLSNAVYGLIDTKGNVIITPKYHSMQVLLGRPVDEQNVIIASDNGKYGLLDKNGNNVTPLVYDSLELWSDQPFIATRDGKYHYLDMQGKTISTKEYDHGDIFWSDRAKVGYNGKFGFLDKSGAEVVPLIYDAADSFYRTVAIVKKDGKYALINNTGKALTGFEYDDIQRLGDDKKMVPVGYAARKGKEINYFNLKGKRVRKKP
jgi:WG containing repeat